MECMETLVPINANIAIKDVENVLARRFNNVINVSMIH
jgi:hypothetical protein